MCEREGVCECIRVERGIERERINVVGGYLLYKYSKGVLASKRVFLSISNFEFENHWDGIK